MDLSRPTRITDKLDDVYHDYLNIVVGYSFDATKIQWRLKEICPRGNNNIVIIIFLVHDNVYILC
jgi:hypothetical protein